MIPMATIFVPDLEHVPIILRHIKMITIFIDPEFWNNLGAKDYKGFFDIRTYGKLEDLESCNYVSEEILPFPLNPQLVDDEFPNWEDVDVVSEPLFNTILDLEKDEIDYYEHI